MSTLTAPDEGYRCPRCEARWGAKVRCPSCDVPVVDDADRPVYVPARSRWVGASWLLLSVGLGLAIEQAAMFSHSCRFVRQLRTAAPASFAIAAVLVVLALALWWLGDVRRSPFAPARREALARVARAPRPLEAWMASAAREASAWSFDASLESGARSPDGSLVLAAGGRVALVRGDALVALVPDGPRGAFAFSDGDDARDALEGVTRVRVAGEGRLEAAPAWLRERLAPGLRETGQVAVLEGSAARPVVLRALQRAK